MSTEYISVKVAFEKFLKEPWPLPDSKMSERKRLWIAFDAGAQYVIDYLRVAIPLPSDVQTDEEVAK